MTQGDSHLLSLRASGGRAPLFCAYVPKEFAIAIKDEHPVYGFSPKLELELQLPTVAHLATIFLDEILKIRHKGPYFLCGYSFGGLVVYEVATRLIKAGEEVRLLALFDIPHPQFKSNLSKADLIEFQVKFLIDRCKKYMSNLTSGNFRNAFADFRAFIVTRFRTITWIAAQRVFHKAKKPPKILQSDSEAISAAIRVYVPEIYTGKLVLFRAQDRRAEYDNDPTLGWRVCVTGKIDIHKVDEIHANMFCEPCLRTITEQVNGYLND